MWFSLKKKSKKESLLVIRLSVSVFDQKSFDGKTKQFWHRPPGGISYEKINIARSFRPFRDGFQNFCVPYNRDGTHCAIVVVAKKSSCVWRCIIHYIYFWENEFWVLRFAIEFWFWVWFWALTSLIPHYDCGGDAQLGERGLWPFNGLVSH